MLEFDVILPEKVSSNAIYSGMHWAKRKALADLYHNEFLDKKGSITQYPVTITYTFSFKGNVLDTTNCFFMAKMLEDAMVAGGILEDDSPQFVSKTIVTSRKEGDKDTVHILIA